MSNLCTRGWATTYPVEASRTDNASELDRLTEILSTVSHELRTPAALIVGLASTLTSNRERMTSAQVTDAIERLERQARRMVRLLDDMLDASRLETGRGLDLALQGVDLGAVVESAVSVASRPQHVALTANVPAGLRVWSEPSALERALVNLLNNAFRYGGPNVAVEVRPAIGGATVSVTDDGPGVCAEIADHLFEPFRASKGGTGLGLVIVRAIAEASGGDVSYEPVVPTGARFSMRLRDESAKRPESRPNPAMNSQAHAPVVLIVDDEPDVLFLLRLTLEQGGYQVEEAPHGGAALDALDHLRPDLLITDLMMPVVDGRELIRRVRDEAELAALPIMLLSASPDDRSGADRVLRKPFDPRQLIREIEELVGGMNG